MWTSPVKSRIIFKLLLLTFQVLYGMAPEYIKDLLNIKKEGNYSLRLESPKGKFLRSFGDRAFSVAAAKLWNELPKYIRHISSISAFKIALKTHLFKLAFNV